MRNNVEKLKSYRSFRVPVEESDKIGFKAFCSDDKGTREELSAILLINVSLTGVGFYSGKEVSSEDEIEVQLTFKGVKFLIPATIVRSQVIYNAYGECEKYFYGVQFLESDQELTKKFLSKFISSFSAKRLKNHLINLLMNEGKLSGQDDLEKIELLLSLFMDMSKFVDVTGFLEMLFIETARLTDSSRTNLFLLNESKTEMVLFDWENGVDTKNSFAFKGSLVEKVFHNRKIVNHRVNKFDDHDSFYNLLLSHYDMQTGSVLLAPVFDSYGNIVGMIEFANKLADDFFDEEDEVYIQLLSKVVTSVFETQNKKTSDEEDESLMRVPRKYELIGNSKFANEMRAFAKRSSNCQSNILLMGEKGTGKSLLAHMIHIESHSGAMACGNFDFQYIKNPAELELALNGDQDHVGKLELYSGGTILLENIEKLELDSQKVLIDTLLNREDIRIITLAHVDLEEQCSKGAFLPELKEYLSTLSYNLPSLTQRCEDIPGLAEYYLSKYCRENGLLPKMISEKVKEMLCDYNWPGNILELKTAMERIVLYYPNFSLIKEVSSEIIPIFNTYSAQENAYKEIIENVELDDFKISSDEFLSLIKAQFVINEITKNENSFEDVLSKMQINTEIYNNIISEAKYILEKYNLDEFSEIKKVA